MLRGKNNEKFCNGKNIFSHRKNNLLFLPCKTFIETGIRQYLNVLVKKSEHILSSPVSTVYARTVWDQDAPAFYGSGLPTEARVNIPTIANLVSRVWEPGCTIAQ